jgi:hypothetical protein
MKIILISILFLTSCNYTPEKLDLGDYKPIQFNSGYEPGPKWIIRDRGLKTKYWRKDEQE